MQPGSALHAHHRGCPVHVPVVPGTINAGVQCSHSVYSRVHYIPWERCSPRDNMQYFFHSHGSLHVPLPDCLSSILLLILHDVLILASSPFSFHTQKLAYLAPCLLGGFPSPCPFGASLSGAKGRQPSIFDLYSHNELFSLWNKLGHVPPPFVDHNGLSLEPQVWAEGGVLELCWETTGGSGTAAVYLHLQSCCHLSPGVFASYYGTLPGPPSPVTWWIW